eukprot:151934-Hanusia_phi.AAC.1
MSVRSRPLSLRKQPSSPLNGPGRPVRGRSDSESEKFAARPIIGRRGPRRRISLSLSSLSAKALTRPGRGTRSDPGGTVTCQMAG